MRKLNIALLSIITLTFLTGCWFNSQGIIEGTSELTTSGTTETSEITEKTPTNSSNSSSTSLTDNSTFQQTNSGNTEVTITSNGSETFDITSSVTSSTGETSSSGENSSETSSTSNAESTTSGGFSECGNFIIEGNEECDDGLRGSGKCTMECTNSSCGDGIINLLAKEECDDKNSVEYDACSNSCYRAKWIFLSKNLYNSNFGGIGNADAYCNDDAQQAGLNGNFKAWLSDMFPTNSPDPLWLNLNFKGWYRMPTDPPSLFAEGFNGLQGNLENSLNVLADGSKNTNLTQAWTATRVNGKKNDAYGNCNSWQDMGFGMGGGIGNPQALDKTWTEHSGPLCGSIQAAIYCMEK